MTRFILIAAALSLFCRWALGKWPWDYLRPAKTREQAIFKARRLLNVSARANHREIRDAHRQMAALLHPDRGGDKAQMQELNAARDLLLNELPYENPEPPQ